MIDKLLSFEFSHFLSPNSMYTSAHRLNDRYVLDAGMYMIETSHSVSENYGLKNFTWHLRKKFPKTKTVFFDCGTPWQML